MYATSLIFIIISFINLLHSTVMENDFVSLTVVSYNANDRLPKCLTCGHVITTNVSHKSRLVAHAMSKNHVVVQFCQRRLFVAPRHSDKPVGD